MEHGLARTSHRGHIAWHRVRADLQHLLRRVLPGRHGKARAAFACSFCGKQRHQVRRLIAGPGVFICNECVALCREIIDQEAGQGT